MGKKDKVNKQKIELSQQINIAANGIGKKKSSKKNKNVPEPKQLKEVVENCPDIILVKKDPKRKKGKLQAANSNEKEHNIEVKIHEGIEECSSEKNEQVYPDIKQAKKNKKQKKAKDTSGRKCKVKKSKVIEADIGVETSESEAEQELIDIPENVNEDQQDPEDDENDNKDEQKTDTHEKKRFPGPEHSIFIGNLPTTVKKSTMKTLFKQFGIILTIRFRTFDGVALFRKKDKKEAKALNCYVRFETREEAEAACCMNGEMVEGNRIRVSLHSQKQLGHITSTVFVGNIHRKTTDNELYEFFSQVGDIEYVRQIADKGIGYVCFKKGVSIAKALKMNQQLLNGRPLRIMKVDPNLQSKRRNKKGNLVNRQKVLPDATKSPRGNTVNNNISQQEFHGTVAKNKNRKNAHKKKPNLEKKKKILAKKLVGAVKGNK